MTKQIISTDRAPLAIGPYSQAVQAGSLVFCSGQIPIDPETGEIRGETSAEQADTVLNNIRGLLGAAGLDFADVVKTTIYMTNLTDFAEVNKVYEKWVPAPFPARSTVGVCALPRGVLVEIEVIAQGR